jgi:hypothetical protein
MTQFLIIQRINSIIKTRRAILNKVVLGYFNEDDTISWCLYHGSDLNTLKKRLIKYHSDIDKLRVILKHDIQSILPGGGYIKHEPIVAQKPFTSKKNMLNTLKDEIKDFLIYDSVDGWLSIKSNGKEKTMKN